MRHSWLLFSCYILLTLLLPRPSVNVAAASDASSAVGQRDRVSLSKKQTKQKLSQALQNGAIKEEEESPVTVKALLIPRSFNLQTMIRMVCLASTLVALLQCFMTAGVPHVRAVWDIVYNNNNDDNTQKTKMPQDYRPKVLDLYLARMMAKTTREIMLPPIILPSAGPLLGLIFSVLMFLGLTVLLPRWFLPMRIFLDYTTLDPQTTTTTVATLPKILVQRNNLQQQEDSSMNNNNNRSSQSTAVLCDLLPSPPPTLTKKKKSRTTATDSDEYLSKQYTHPYPHYFELYQCRYYYDLETGHCINGGPMMEGAPLADIQSLIQRGLSKLDRQIAKERYEPYNRPKLATPTIAEAFATRMSSPLVVIQTLGRLLSLLEDGSRTLVGAAGTIWRHYWDARQAIMMARQMSQDVQASARDTSNLQVHVLKNRKKNTWQVTTADELVPGDVFVLPRPRQQQNDSEDHLDELIIPVDALVLDGQGLTNEAVLTGESVPQSKIPIDFEEERTQHQHYDMMNNHRSSTLFAGTSLVHCSSDGVSAARLQSYNILPPQNVTGGALTCLTLRTGTYSSKGQLLRALKSSTNVGAISNDQADKDALRLITSLSVFALVSCVSLFLGETRKPVSPFRRAIQCTRIAIASIPSDLPLALSHVAKSCSRQLRREYDVVCAEPGALLTAAYVDTVVFDKTGTLTADTQSLSKLISNLPGDDTSPPSPNFGKFILAGCHSLVQITRQGTNNATIVGDPLDMSALQYSSWRFNHTTGAYDSPQLNNINNTTSSLKSSDPIRLWQIRSFPFDPNKRLSSALVLAETADHECHLWMLTKGSPGTMAKLYTQDNNDDDDDSLPFTTLFNNRTQELEAQGYRCIALGATELSSKSTSARTLFPNGFSSDEESIQYARAQGSALHRSEFENLQSTNTNTNRITSSVDQGLEFHGFACFNAKVRPSSKRVIKELHDGGIQPVMLTGDAIDAALAVASKVGLIKERKVAILETFPNNSSSASLRWRFVTLKDGKASPSSLPNSDVNKKSVQGVIQRQKQGKYALAATGEALELILNDQSSFSENKIMESLADNMFRFSVLARATPSLKTLVVTCLKHRCGKTVMMCGDGVNDVSAMKAADVAVALLNGFGAEGENELAHDLDDKRRLEKVKLKKLGRYRRNNNNGNDPSMADPRKAGRNKMNAKIDAAHAEIRQRAIVRQGKEDDPGSVILELKDMKEMMSATISIVKEESNRQKALNKGGKDAARILAEERKLQSNATTNGDESGQVTMEAESIKPGEASLVASFSCLHPSIDGVDAVLRSGIATAACALAAQKTIALHSLMACYQLASLYRDGFRYGKNMWPIEFYMYLIMEDASFNAACTPRPRLPRSKTLRPPISMFHPSCILSTVGQAIVHLVTMAIGVGYARQLQTGTRMEKTASIRLAEGSHFGKIKQLLDALVSGVVVDEEGEVGHFRRPPFRPNYETNIVFLLSILQSAITSLVNHKGRPFHRSILETRYLSFVAGATLMFAVACIFESFPALNNMLQLRTMPDGKSKLIFLGIVAANILVCVGCRVLSELSTEKYDKNHIKRRKSSSRTAADLEEELLDEEAKQNLQRSFLFLAAAAYFATESLSKRRPAA